MSEPLSSDELAAIVARAEEIFRDAMLVTCKCGHTIKISRSKPGVISVTCEKCGQGVDGKILSLNDVPRLAAEVTRLNARLAAVCEKAEKLKEAAKGRDFTLELETAIADLAAALGAE